LISGSGLAVDQLLHLSSWSWFQLGSTTSAGPLLLLRGGPQCLLLGCSWKEFRLPHAYILRTVTSLIEFADDLLLLEIEASGLRSQVLLLRKGIIQRQHLLRQAALLTLVAEHHLTACSEMVHVHL